jgi:hypothetical protein
MTTWSDDFGARLRNTAYKSTQAPVPAATNDALWKDVAKRLESRIVASSNIVGPAGPQGNAGPMGEAGPTGPVGPAGSQGPIGEAGPIGPPGLTGPMGETGAPGPIGPQGVAGPVGPAGEQGIPGPIGEAGPIGPTGNTGATGGQGPIGNTGAQGIQGVAGPVGPAGSQGPIGLTGATGPAGAQGIQGVAGPTGAAGSVGPQGPIGNTGAQGIQGPTGPSAVAFPLRAATPKIAGCGNGTALTTQALTAARQYFIPFVVPRNITLTSLRTTVTTVQAGSTLSFGIYSNVAGADDAPGALLASVIGQSSAATGDKTGAVSLVLTAGTLYWASVICSAGATLRAVAVGGVAPALGFTVGAVTAVTHLFAAGAGSTLPASAPGVLSDGVTGIPAVYLLGS